MAQAFPYTYYACPCRHRATKSSATGPNPNSVDDGGEDEDEHGFDPRDPRSNYALYPIEHLLYCTDCHEMRCPRCISEEVVCWFCPNCLFEVPSSSVRSDGNRCTRNCYNCPICTSILSISSLEKPADGVAPPEAEKQLGGPFFLSCPYCQWSSLDIGIHFEKHFNLTAQLQKMFKSEWLRAKPLVSSPTSPRDEEAEAGDERRASIVSGTSDPSSSPQAQAQAQTDRDAVFANLNKFYRQQLSDLADSGGSYGVSSDLSYNSPSSITRLMNLYSSGGRMKKDRPKPARDAAAASEGLCVFEPASDVDKIRRVKELGWEETASREQRALQCREHVHFTDELRPLATALRTKRSKRCKSCRQILTRPEQKVSSTRYKIKLLAVTNVPKVTLRPMRTAQPAANASFPMQAGTGPAQELKALTTHQFLLTVTNPLFDPIRVTLATPSTTPGRIKSRVTILCPEFDVGANTDVWDAELASATDRGSRRASQMLGAGAGGVAGGDAAGAGAGAGAGGVQAEAGKVWAKGRNWTSVVVEVMAGALPGGVGHVRAGAGDGDAELELDEDEDVLEIPVFVRLEYETEGGADEERSTAAARRADEGGNLKERREEAFWAVLGAGRITWAGA